MAVDEPIDTQVTDEPPVAIPSAENEIPVAQYGPDMQTGTTEIKYPSGFVLIIIVTGLLLSLFLSIIATAIPSITSEFHSMDDVGWYGSAFFLTLAAFQAFWGKAYKYYSLRLVFMASIAVFEIGSLVAALAPNSIALIVGRAIQGVGGSGLTSGCYTIAAFLVPPERVNIIIGLLGSTFSLSSVVGPLLGGVFTQTLSWRWCFWINLPIGGAAIFGLLFFRPPPHSRSNSKMGFKHTVLSFDPPGVILVTGSLVSFFLALQWGGITKAWSSRIVIALLVVWVVLTIIWVVLEWFQKDRALMAPRILANRNLAACCIFVFFLSSANFSLIYNIPLYFQAVKGKTPLLSGILTIPTILSTSISTFLSSAIVARIGFYQPFLIVGSVLATIGAGLIYTWNLDTGLGRIIGYQILYGGGTGIAVQVPVIVAGVVTSNADQAISTATVLFFQFVAAAYGVGATDSILNNLLLSSLPRYLPGEDPLKVLSIGSSALQTRFQGQKLHGAREAYIQGLHGSWALAIALFGASFLASLIPKSGGPMIPRQTLPDQEKQRDSDENPGIVVVPA
ncbi:MFS gliotoxin efflux transporter glia [Xylaria cf. heliscus]|nr:MFS gliotoxin efflux transporter glia [Xylaria cf. heliscus]